MKKVAEGHHTDVNSLMEMTIAKRGRMHDDITTIVVDLDNLREYIDN